MTIAIDERSRHQLHNKLAELLGQDEAATLMDYLPPLGWADVATKRDLDHLEVRVMAEMRRELMSMQRHIVTIVLTVVLVSNLTLAGLAFAAAKLV